MADICSHIKQSKHNLECAKRFKDISHSQDWAVTATFYAAVHYVEAGFLAVYNKTSDQYSGNTTSDTLHTKRISLARDTFGNKCYKILRDLYIASLNTRYLKSNTIFITDHPAEEYYSEKEIDDYINIDFQQIYQLIQDKLIIDGNKMDLRF